MNESCQDDNQTTYQVQQLAHFTKGELYMHKFISFESSSLGMHAHSVQLQYSSAVLVQFMRVSGDSVSQSKIH
jgi:hypothetical protein